jgi:RNA-binding protein
MPDRLSSRQRAHLRSLAHDRDVLVHVGKAGLSDPVMKTIEEAFNTRELLKVRVLDTAEMQPQAVGEAVAEAMDGVRIVQTKGWTLTLYRPDPDDPEIDLPARGG